MCRVGTDTGGTFTDVVLLDEGESRFVIDKVLTTTPDPSEGVVTGMLQAADKGGYSMSDLAQIIHGTTLVTNAIIERAQAPVALFATSGFRDTVEIRREHRFDLYDTLLEFQKPLSPRYLRFDIPERTFADGTIGREVDTDVVERLAGELWEKGVRGVAVSFLHSFMNSQNEEAARNAILRSAPAMRVSLSSEVAPEIREYERTSTTIANVYVQNLVQDYLSALETEIRTHGFEGQVLMMQSNGGTATLETSSQFPIRLLESGPAAGALAAASIGRTIDLPHLLSFDMGGTTAKLSAIEDFEPRIRYEFEIDRMYRFKLGSGLPVRLPVIDMIEIGAGGGSIAYVDTLGLLKVGPRSAGAQPGPACYGFGGDQPTVTDANLVLGYLDPDFFLGGAMALDRRAAEGALRNMISRQLDISVEEAAWGVYEVVTESMANAARMHLVERGRNPGDLPIVAFGGAGPAHAFHIASRLGSPSVIVPPAPGVGSAYGFLMAPLAFDFVRSYRTLLEDLDWQRVENIYAEMGAAGSDVLRNAGVDEADIRVQRLADIRYVGQGYELRVPVPDTPQGSDPTVALRSAFEGVYKETYHRDGPPVPVEITNWRIVSSGPPPQAHPLRLSLPGSGDPRKGERPAFFGSRVGYIETPVYDRYLLQPGSELEGPAIVEERESTVVVPPGRAIVIDDNLNLIGETSQ
jgi:N-methylhydantoinase A